MSTIRDKNDQIEALQALLDNGPLNTAQRAIIERLIETTKRETEDRLAAYIDTMDAAAVHWALNHFDLFQNI